MKYWIKKKNKKNSKFFNAKKELTKTCENEIVNPIWYLCKCYFIKICIV